MKNFLISVQLSVACLTLLSCDVLALAAVRSNSGVTLTGADLQNQSLWEIDPTTGRSTVIGFMGAEILGLAFDANHRILYGSSKSTLYLIDQATGATQRIGDFGHELMHAIEYDSVNDQLYGITLNDDPVGLWRIDVATADLTAIGPTPDSINGMAFDASTSTMYASNIASQELTAVDLMTGAVSVIGKFNAGVQVGTGLAYDPTFGLVATDNFANATGGNAIYQIDLATGQATLIGTTSPGNLLGLAFLPQGIMIPEPNGMTLAAFAVCVLVRRRLN